MDNESLSGLQAVPADHPLRLLIQAYTRLALITAQADGTKMVSIARCGAFDLRLIEFPLEGETEGAVPLWVELFDHAAGLVIDSASCRDLDEAGAVTHAFMAEARERRPNTSPCAPMGTNH